MKAAHADVRDTGRCRVTNVTSALGSVPTRVPKCINWLIL